MRDEVKLWFIALCGLLLLFNPYYRNTASDIEELKIEKKNPHFQDFVNDFERYFQNQMRFTGTPGGAVVIIKDDVVYLKKGYGVKKNSRSERDSVNAHTVFRIGSLSKGFASVLTGIYVEDELLSWDDKVQEFIPEFSLKNDNNGSDVNLEHVLSQTTGVGYHAYTSAIESGWTLDEIIPKFAEVNLNGNPGERYSYQNAIYSLVGKIQEQVSEMPLDSIYEKRLFGPLGMNDASVTYDAMENGENRATPHILRGYWKPTQITEKYYNAIPAGGVNASISDMAEWLRLLLGNRDDVIADETLDKIFTPIVNTHNKRRYFSRWRDVKDAYYGLGYRVVEREQDTLVYHGGYVNGFKGDILVNPEDKIAICILTNAPSSLSSISIPAFLNKYDHYRELILDWKPEEEPSL